jgi:hypothetical protein
MTCRTDLLLEDVRSVSDLDAAAPTLAQRSADRSLAIRICVYSKYLDDEFCPQVSRIEMILSRYDNPNGKVMVLLIFCA